MNLTNVTALNFHKTMAEGRTSPLLVEAVDADGNYHELVMKCFSPSERGHEASAVELVCSLLATELGLSSPPPFIVTLHQGFLDQLNDPFQHERLTQNPGPYFGSTYLTEAFTVSPKSAIRHDHLSQAGGVFSFDCLAQNPDRRREKPNLLLSAAGYHLIDRDQAFSDFSGMIIGGPVAPWNSAARQSKSYDYLNNHLLREGLKGQVPHLRSFEETLDTLQPDRISSILEKIPAEWDLSESFKESLDNHLKTAVFKAKEITAFNSTFLS